MTADIVQMMMDTYAKGYFPMAETRDSADAFWVDPPMRGIIPLDNFNIPRSLKKFMQNCPYRVTFDTAFADVIAACAEVPRDRDGGTWINPMIENLFNRLHEAGHAHSVEIWDETGNLVGGLYGLAQKGCFNGESMFSTRENASKVALVHLVAHLKTQGFTLLDTQFVNDHLLQFGCIEISKNDYMDMLRHALQQDVTF